MKRTLLVATLAGLGLAAAPAARAQIPVTDAASIARAGLDAARQLQQLITQYETMKQQLLGIQQTVGALSNPRAILQDAPGLLGRVQQLPGSAANAMPGLGFGSQSSAAAQPFLNQNRYYTPQTTGDFAAQEMQRRAQVTANLQGEVQTGLDTADQRIALLSQLQAAVESKPDQMSVSTAQAHITGEQTFLGNEQANVQRLQVTAQMADRVDQQRAAEHDRQSAEDWTQQSTAAAAAAGLSQ